MANLSTRPFDIYSLNVCHYNTYNAYFYCFVWGGDYLGGSVQDVVDQDMVSKRLK